MAYPQSSPRGNPNLERKVPLKDPIGKGQQPSIIESKSSKLMISIRKENPNPQANPYPKHQENASTVEKKVILEQCKQKAKALMNTLVTNQTSKYEIFKLLELDHSDNESSSSSGDQEIPQIY